MLLKEALNKASENEVIKSLTTNKGYLFTAVMSILSPSSYEVKQWILIYYNNNENKTIQAIIEEGKKIEVKSAEEPLKPSKQELQLSQIKTNSDKMIKKAVKEFQGYKKQLSQLIINLIQKENHALWRFSFITKTLEVITIEINAKTGEITRKEKQKLVK